MRSPQHMATWTFNVRLMRHAPRPFALYATCNILFYVGQLVPGFIVQAIFDRLTRPASAGLSIPALIALLASIEVARFTTSFGQVWADVTFRLTTGALLRRNILAAILRRPGAVALPVAPGAAVNRFRDDVDETSDFPTWFPHVFAFVLEIGVAVTIMAHINLTITIYAVLPLLVAGIIARASWDWVRRYFALESKATDEVTGFLAEAFGAVQAVKLAGASATMTRHFDELNRSRQAVAVRWRLVEEATGSMTASTLAIGIGAVLFLAGQGIAHRTFSIGQFALFVYLLELVAEYATDLGNFLGDYAAQAISIVRMEELVRPEPPAAMLHDRQTGSGTVDFQVDPRAEPLDRLQIRGLTFAHESGAGIRDVDAEVLGGGLTVVTGRVGCGKTTLLRALLGLLPMETGEIRWNGKIVADPAAFFRPPRAAYVSQVPQLFSEPLVDNVLMGWQASEGQLDEAIRQAVLEEDVPELSDGLNTIVGPRGVRLSGGQIQRTAAARAFVRRPALLVLDDLSSALDVDTEQRLWDRLLARSDITTLAVSHRRTALSRAGHVILMQDGGVAAQGTLAQLLETSEEMGRIWAAEERNEEGDSNTD